MLLRPEKKQDRKQKERGRIACCAGLFEYEEYSEFTQALFRAQETSAVCRLRFGLPLPRRGEFVINRASSSLLIPLQILTGKPPGPKVLPELCHLRR